MQRIAKEVNAVLQTLSKPQLGEKMYHLLERVVNSHAPLEIEFKGQILRISVKNESGDKFAALEPHPDCLVGDSEDIVHLDWSGEMHHVLS